ncbi:MAG: glycogen debranching protein [Solirubrobacteraceae bacterium]
MRRHRAVIIGVAGALATCATAQASVPELSTSSRLQDRREVAAGQRSYTEGFQDGRFYANGWHSAGEMGGVWAPPLKLVDGVWFGIDNSWVGQATRFSSGWGYTRYNLPDAEGLQLQRTDFAPDFHRAALFGLKMTNPGASKTFTVKVDSHSELMGAYPWGFSGVVPNASDNLPDHGSFDGSSLVFTDNGSIGSGAPVHHYAALVGADRRPVSGTAAATGGNFRGPQPGKACAASDSTSPPSACDDGPFGNGTGGELRYRIRIPAHGSRTLWIAVAGSDQGLGAARSELAGALDNPARELAAKIASREELASHTSVSLPGDPLLQNAIDWGKQNLADLTQTASALQIRWTNQGKQFPAPLGTVPRARWFGAGFPDYPWLFATDGEYTAFAAVALGQFQTIEDHLRALRDVSDILNHGSGIVVHETVSDGSVWFGHDSQTTSSDGAVSNDFNTDETVKFPSAVALVWRWTGDNQFRDEMYDFAKRNMHAIDQRFDVDRDGWPEGSGNVERPGMGAEKLDNGIYYMRGLYDLADMARSKHDTATATWATNLADRLRTQFENTWWDPSAGQYADSLLDPGNQQSFQKHWIGVTPMEADLTTGTQVTPGVAAHDHAVTALSGRETPCFSGSRPGNLGLFHTGCGGGADGKGDFEIFSLTTSIQAVAEGNYGRLGPDQQQRYTDANAETMFSEPATGNTPDEQPGAMPEIFPSAPNGDPSAGIPPNIDRCWTCRSMFMQAWGNYGTAWSVVHQQLGVRPFLGDGALQIVPQVPDGQPSVAGSNVQLGSGAVDVFASHAGSTYTTKVLVHGLHLRSLEIGHTLPAGSTPDAVVVDGQSVQNAAVRQTNRGVEVTVPVSGNGPHTLTVTSA